MVMACTLPPADITANIEIIDSALEPSFVQTSGTKYGIVSRSGELDLTNAGPDVTILLAMTDKSGNQSTDFTFYNTDQKNVFSYSDDPTPGKPMVPVDSTNHQFGHAGASTVQYNQSCNYVTFTYHNDDYAGDTNEPETHHRSRYGIYIQTIKNVYVGEIDPVIDNGSNRVMRPPK
jgi:hypothetical protein